MVSGALEVVFGDGRAPFGVGLSSLHDVLLEDAGPGVLVGNYHCFRIVLVVGESRERLLLSKGGLPNLIASENLAHARAFLRSCGWEPESEP
jgi:hypothetical protein